MNVALAASRKVFVTLPVIHRVEEMLDAFKPGDTLLVRSPGDRRPTSLLEANAVVLAVDRDINVQFFSPRESGRAGIYRRDYELVLAADEVVAYFDQGSEIDGGTWHVVHAAMQKGILCRAFTINQDGQTELLGSEDGESPFLDADVSYYL